MEEGKFQTSTPGPNGLPAEHSNSLFNISMEGLRLLLERKMDINGLFILHLYQQQAELTIDEPRIGAWTQALRRKKYLTAENTVTIKGRELLGEVARGTTIKAAVYDKKDDPFEKWWREAYPSTDYLEYKGRVFHGTQAKHFEKEECRQLFWDIVNEGKYTWEDIYWGTVCNVENAKELSLISGRSEIHFITNSKRYLELRKFIPFVEAGRRKSAGTRQTHNTPVQIHDFDI